MRIIISPAKKMTTDTDTFTASGKPRLLSDTEVLLEYLRQRSYGELKNIWRCNDKLCELNFGRIREMDIRGECLTPALISYEGIQYQYLSPKTLESEALDYLQDKLRILSGFYGILSPMEGVEPYRLEMQAELCPTLEKASGEKFGNLYDFWGDKLYRQLFSDEDTVINLASKEDSKAVEPYLTKKDRFISCLFCEMKGEKPTQKATLSKMARGEMVRFMAQQKIEDIEGIKDFTGLGFSYNKEISDEKTFIFIR